MFNQRHALLTPGALPTLHGRNHETLNHETLKHRRRVRREHRGRNNAMLNRHRARPNGRLRRMLRSLTKRTRKIKTRRSSNGVSFSP
jgi:hypothetical protein